MATSSTRSKKRRLFRPLTLALLGAGVAGGILAWPFAKKQYHRWGAESHARKAAEFLAQGDPRRALLSARSALEHNAQDPGVTRIMAKILEAIGAPEAEQWRARLDTLQPGDAENTLARARAALKAGGIETAERLTNSLSPADRNSAAYHALAAAIALEKRDIASAETHWTEASRLEPAEKRHLLNLAAVRLESRAPAVRDEALAALGGLRRDPATSVEAMRLLLTHSANSRETEKTRELADALVKDARSTFNDKLARLGALRMIHDARSGPYLLELRDAAVSEPADFFNLLSWMNGKDLSLMVAEWVRWMPQDLISKLPVCLGVADAYLRTGDWQKLEEMTATSKWAEMDYMRRAYLARALGKLDESEEAAKEWENGVAAALGRPDAQERLIKFAMRAKWDKRAEEIMWPLALTPQCPRWILDWLWQAAYKREETTQLQKLSAAIVKKDPSGIAARNNYAFLSLLTRSGEGNPHQIAENLHRENPKNAVVASTYGLSLFQRGKANEAANLMAGMDAEDLKQPQIAFYYAIFLIASGQTNKAGEYLKISADWPVLPEEKALSERVKTSTSTEEVTPSPSRR